MDSGFRQNDMMNTGLKLRLLFYSNNFCFREKLFPHDSDAAVEFGFELVGGVFNLVLGEVWGIGCCGNLGDRGRIGFQGGLMGVRGPESFPGCLPQPPGQL